MATMDRDLDALERALQAVKTRSANALLNEQSYLARIAQLFPQAMVHARRVTLAPPLARAVCRLHPGLYTLLNTVPWLRTHVLAWLGKP